MRDMQAFSDVVVLAIKAALAPVQERLALAEQVNKDLQARLADLSDLRDRVVTFEVKAAAPPVVAEPVTVDLTPLYERMAAAEARLDVLGDLRDRVVTVEAKAAVPVVVPAEGPSAADAELAMRDRLEPLAKQLGTLSERLAVMEVRQPIPGPAGEKGMDGRDGTNGKDGVDGLGFDDITAEQTDDRRITLKAQRGDRVKVIGTAVFPVQIQRGVYAEGTTYERGDVVTWAGSQWHCDEETATKPGESKSWTLVVKRGRDGRDGKDAVSLPVISVGARP